MSTFGIIHGGFNRKVKENVHPADFIINYIKSILFSEFPMICIMCECIHDF